MIAHRLIQPEEIVPTIVSLQQRLETVRQGEIDRVRGRLGRLSSEQENAIESLTRSIINRILHPAMTVLKTASAENESTVFVEIVHRIFNLAEKPIPERGPARAHGFKETQQINDNVSCTAITRKW